MGLVGWAVVVLLVSLISGLLGFTNLAMGAADIAKLLFGVFLIIFVILIVMAIVGGSVPR